MTSEHDQVQEQTTTRWTGGRDAFGDFSPGLVHYTDAVLFDEVWERPDLSMRDRSLVTVAALTAMGRTEHLSFHLRFALDNGVTPDELTEALLHLAFYAGWPNGMSATAALKKVVEADGPHPSSHHPTPAGAEPQVDDDHEVGDQPARTSDGRSQQ